MTMPKPHIRGLRVGVTQAAPSDSVALQLDDTTAGVLINRVTTTQRNAIAAPTAGLLVFNTTTVDFDFYNGSAWQSVASAGISTDGLTFTAVGAGITFKIGTNGRFGTITLNGATPVTIANTSVGANDVVMISLKTVGGTVGAQPHLATITPGTGFTVVGTAGDTSVYNYCILGAAA